MTLPLVSVVIPTYNQPHLLRETLASVLAQTFTDYEIVIVDDGSTDDTPAFLASFAAEHPDVCRIITQPNAGIGAARNRGIAEARGTYVALLDHDDLWLPTKLAAQVSFFAAHPDCLTVSVPYALSTSPDRCTYSLDIRDPAGLVPRPLRAMVGHGFFPSSALMFHRLRAAGIHYAQQRDAIEDVPFLIPLFARGPVGIAGDHIQMIYRIHPANASARAPYYYHGTRLLHRLRATGGFADVPPDQRLDMDAFLALNAHAAAVRQLHAGQRLRAARLVASEFPLLLRHGHLRFLAAFPFLFLAPRPLIHRRFPLSDQPCPSPAIGEN